MKPYWVKAAEYCGIQLSALQMTLMGSYANWLGEEAVRAGGVGPKEVVRLERRHLGDSVLFAKALGHRSQVWDLGSGVGLPGIPLAICLRDTEFILIDRSQRRLDLTRRAVRILGLDNCQVIHGEINDLSGEVPAMVSRASLPPDRLREVGERLLSPGGVLVAGGSWRRPPQHRGWSTLEIPRDVLDQPVWLLIMRRE